VTGVSARRLGNTLKAGGSKKEMTWLEKTDLRGGMPLNKSKLTGKAAKKEGGLGPENANKRGDGQGDCMRNRPKGNKMARKKKGKKKGSRGRNGGEVWERTLLGSVQERKGQGK